MKEKMNYEQPVIEINDLLLEDSIAQSVSGSSLWEELW